MTAAHPTASATRRHGAMDAIGASCLSLCLGMLCVPAQAARPLGTDDAGTNAARQCQLEAWSDHGHGEHAWHLAPACGVGAGLEVGWESFQRMPGQSGEQGRALALKWAPEWLDWQGWRFGIKYSGAQGRESGSEDTGWHLRQTNLTGIVSIPLGQDWAVHANVGRTQLHGPAEGRTSYALALTWTPHERWLAFAEAMGDHRCGATRNVGLRWWLIPDVLGVDLTHSVTNATPGSRRSGVGLGWYGVQF